MLAIIPARGGSKGIPGKNIKLLNGNPLITYTFECAKKSKLIDRVICSTDDPKIASIASQYQIEVPFIRPAYLATDTSLAIDTYLYTIDRLNKEFNCKYEDFIVLLPTSPLRLPTDVDAAIKVFKENQADSVISVCDAPYPPTWSRRISSDGILRFYFPETEKLQNRQAFDKAYIPNGSIYIFSYDFLNKTRNYYSDKTYPFIMPPERSIDIDSQFDFDIAEFLIRKAN